MDLFLIYEEDGEEYLTKLTQKVGYSTINYTNSAFKVDDLYDATITIDDTEKWRLNKQIKDFIEDFKANNLFSKVRYFTDKNSVNMLVEDISKLKEMTMFSRYTGNDMTKIEYMTNNLFSKVRYFTDKNSVNMLVEDISKLKEMTMFSRYTGNDMTKIEYMTNFMYYIEKEFNRYFTDKNSVNMLVEDISKLKEMTMFSRYTGNDMTKIEYMTNFMYYIEKEFNGVKTSDIDKYKMEEFENMDFIGWLIKSGEMGDYLEWKMEEFENMDFIGWLIKSGEMGDYLEWRSEKSDLGGCIIQVDEGKVNPKVFEKMLKNENIRELNIKFRR